MYYTYDKCNFFFQGVSLHHMCTPGQVVQNLIGHAEELGEHSVASGKYQYFYQNPLKVVLFVFIAILYNLTQLLKSQELNISTSVSDPGF